MGLFSVHFLGRRESEAAGPNTGDGAGLILACREGNDLRASDLAQRMT